MRPAAFERKREHKSQGPGRGGGAPLGEDSRAGDVSDCPPCPYAQQKLRNPPGLASTGDPPGGAWGAGGLRYQVSFKISARTRRPPFRASARLDFIEVLEQVFALREDRTLGGEKFLQTRIARGTFLCEVFKVCQRALSSQIVKIRRAS